MSYVKNTWETGDIITHEKLQHIEEGIEQASQSGGIDDYTELINKPSINDIELKGNKSLSNLGIQEELTSGTNIKTINSQSILGAGNINVSGGGGEISDDVKVALLNCFQNVVWTTASGQEYYTALYNALYNIEPHVLESITAVFTQGSAVIYDNATLESLKEYLVVTANYSDSTTETVTNYTLSGTLTVGTSTITVTYGEKTTTFTVNVTATPTVTGIEATYTQGQTPVYPNTNLNSLKSNLVVKAIFSDNTKSPLEDAVYTLSGTLTVGTSTVTVTYETFTTTFTVTVSEIPVLSSIDAVYTQSGVVYPSTSLDSLKQSLVVTAEYSDSSTQTVPSSDYTLSGTLAVGTSTVTVTYQEKTTTFDVTVSAAPTLSSIEATFSQGSEEILDNASLDSLKEYLTVVAIYSDSSTVTLDANDYTLSGTLTAGTSTITATYENKTDTFDVVVISHSPFQIIHGGHLADNNQLSYDGDNEYRAIVNPVGHFVESGKKYIISIGNLSSTYQMAYGHMATPDVTVNNSVQEGVSQVVCNTTQNTASGWIDVGTTTVQLSEGDNYVMYVFKRRDGGKMTDADVAALQEAFTFRDLVDIKAIETLASTTDSTSLSGYTFFIYNNNNANKFEFDHSKKITAVELDINTTGTVEIYSFPKNKITQGTNFSTDSDYTLLDSITASTTGAQKFTLNTPITLPEGYALGFRGGATWRYTRNNAPADMQGFWGGTATIQGWNTRALGINVYIEG